MTQQELLAAHRSFTDAWELYKAFSDVEDTESYWQRLAAAASKYNKDHGKTSLSEALGVVVMLQMEKQANRRGATIEAVDKLEGGKQEPQGGK